jgi:hypothetical protein
MENYKAFILTNGGKVLFFFIATGGFCQLIISTKRKKKGLVCW